MSDTSTNEAAELSVPLSQVQAGIFDPAAPTFETHVLLEICDMAAARAFVGSLANEVTTEADVSGAAGPATRVSVGFTSEGLAALGVAASVLDSFPREFLDGMPARAIALGDNGPNDPVDWDAPYRTDEQHRLHMWLMVQGDDSTEVEARVVEVVEPAVAAGAIRELGREHGQQFGPDRAPAKEHFGFNDNLSQPGVAGVGQPVYPGQGTLQPDGTWDPIPVGCFLLGYENGYGDTPLHPSDATLRNNGTYMVLRKLEQDVPAFREAVADTATRFGMDEQLCAAKFVGRWRSGAPLEICPEHDDPSVLDDHETANSFHYRGPDRVGGDAGGQRVPRGAHIRRVNPRDSFTIQSVVDPKNHRIIRRSAPYGRYLEEGSGPDGVRRGLLFRAFNASILDQFEMIQSEWVNNSNENQGVSTDRDPFVGSVEPMGHPSRRNPPSFTIPQPDGTCPTRYGLPQFVTVRGGAYFFVPSIDALRGLAVPLPPPPDPPPPLPAPFLASYEAIAGIPGIQASQVRELQINLVLGYQAHLVELGDELRSQETTKIFETPIGFLLSTYDDIVEVFRNDEVFSVSGYAERLQDVTGPFILGMDRGPEYEYESSIMHAALPSSGLAEVAEWVDDYAARVVARTTVKPGVPFDLVAPIAQRIPLAYIDRFLGVPGTNDQTLMSWLQVLGLHVFEFWTPYVPPLPGRQNIKAVATSISPTFEAYLDGLITDRIGSIAAGQPVPEDVLTRLVRLSTTGGQSATEQAITFDHVAIRRNLAGFALGSTVAASTAIVSAVQYLLTEGNEQALAQTVEAAGAGDGDRVQECMLEAARLGAPSPPSVFRTAKRDHVLAEGTDREKKIPAGAVVALYPCVAMTDPSAIETPKEFRPGRPSSNYLMFGEGQHSCFGTATALMFLRSAGLHLFALPGLKQVSPMTPGTGTPGAYYPGEYMLICEP
ncbi:cytochrome P450 [Ilumatobacter nonamiensis]|uniref:cytochrome P450 n=1 Tax=Ilumatobacter nonamiensis TaxID=467093 RepID=UPI00034B4B86|nr:cytochrome P450 [Ilumatobacter nonamiensis]